MVRIHARTRTAPGAALRMRAHDAGRAAFSGYERPDPAWRFSRRPCRRGYLATVVVLVTGFVFVTQVVTVFVTVVGLVVVVVR